MYVSSASTGPKNDLPSDFQDSLIFYVNKAFDKEEYDKRRRSWNKYDFLDGYIRLGGPIELTDEASSRLSQVRLRPQPSGSWTMRQWEGMMMISTNIEDTSDDGLS